MNNLEILNRDMVDLKVALEVSEIYDSVKLREYVDERIEKVSFYINVNALLPRELIRDAYVIDLVLFFNLTVSFNDIEGRDYFRWRILEIVDIFPDLLKRDDIRKIV